MCARADLLPNKQVLFTGCSGEMLVRDNPRGWPSGSDRRTNVRRGERERSDITNLWIYHNPIDTNSIVYDRLPLIRSDYVHFLAISKPIRFSPNIIDEELFGTVNKLFPCQQVHFYIHINRKGLMCTIWVKSYFFLYMYLSTFVEHYIKTTLPLQTLILLNSISSHFYFVKNQQHQNQTVN